MSNANNGGKREGAGRKKGIPNKKTAAMIAAIETAGITPLEFMLNVLRDESADYDKRLDAAKSAAPYVHAKLTSIANTNDKPFQTSLEIFFQKP